MWRRGSAATLASAAPSGQRALLPRAPPPRLALSARGCHASSLATARLALSLDRDDPTRLALRIDLLALRAHQPAALLALHDAHGAAAEWHKYPGYAWSLALASARPTAAASRDGTAPARSYDDVRVGDIPRELKARAASALLDFPMMVPAALHACAASNAAATALGGARNRALGRSNLEPPSTALRHLVALYWERAAELWSARPLIAWLIDEATHALDTLDDAALGRGPAACARWWRPGVANPFQGDAYAALRSEQVVIPEEEEGGGRRRGPPVPEVEVVEAADGADGGGGGGFAELAPLEEETEALAAPCGRTRDLCSAAAAWRRRCAASSANDSRCSTSGDAAHDRDRLRRAAGRHRRGGAARAQGAPRAGGRALRARRPALAHAARRRVVMSRPERWRLQNCRPHTSQKPRAAKRDGLLVGELAQADEVGVLLRRHADRHVARRQGGQPAVALVRTLQEEPRAVGQRELRAGAHAEAEEDERVRAAP